MCLSCSWERQVRSLPLSPFVLHLLLHSTSQLSADGVAGSVDCGAIDPLSALAAFAAENRMWFHVDAAFGALGCLSPLLRPLFAGIEQADSVAFDFHKWGQVPYDAGCLLVRDKAAHIAAFGLNATYLKREGRGLAGGDVWPCDFGAA